MKIKEEKNNRYRKLHWWEDSDAILSGSVFAIGIFIVLLIVL